MVFEPPNAMKEYRAGAYFPDAVKRKEGVWAINIPAFCTQNTAIGSPQKTHNGVVKQLVNGLPSITLVHPFKAYSLGKQTR